MVVSLYVPVAWGQSACIPPLSPSEQVQPAQSVHLYVAALRRADRAHDILTTMDTSADVLLSMRRAATEARCAEMLAAMVSERSDSLMREAFALAEVSFGMIATGIDGLRESMVRQAEAGGSSARDADRDASSIELMDNGWKGLVAVTLGVVGSLQTSPSGSGGIAMSAHERDALRVELRSQFGRELTAADARTNYARLAAYTMQSLLAREP